MAEDYVGFKRNSSLCLIDKVEIVAKKNGMFFYIASS